MNIIPVFDPSMDSAPAGYRSAVQTVLSWFDGVFANEVTVTIGFGWGEVGGQAVATGAVAQSRAVTQPVGYAALKDALVAHAAQAEQKTAVASLPSLDPSNGAGFEVTSAQARALGLAAAAPPTDGWVGLNSSLAYAFDPLRRTQGGHDAIGALMHEVSEVLGRISGVGTSGGPFTALDLFRHSGASIDLKAEQAAFSVDGGATQPALLNDPTNGGDAGDWVNGFDAFAAVDSGQRGAITDADLLAMNAIGYPVDRTAVGPHLVGTSLTPGASGVSVMTSIIFSFDRPVAPSSGYFTFTAPDGDRYVASATTTANGQITLSGSTVTFTPTEGFHPGETYRLSVAYDALTDLSGMPFGGVQGGGLSFSTESSAQLVSEWFGRVLRVDSTAPAFSDAAAGVQIDLDQHTAPGLEFNQVLVAARSTSDVATLSYQFFTGRTPGAAGMDYLVNPAGPNPSNLNSAYYQGFNEANRFINFASNLGRAGAGSAQFAAQYGGLTPEQAMTQAYQAIFGGTPSADKVGHLLSDPVPDGLGGTYARLQYFESYGGDGPSGIGTKAAMVGWLLSEAVRADLGTYAQANDAFLTDVGLHNAPFGVDLIGVYAQAGFVYQPG